MIKQDIDNLILIKKLSWQQVFNIWRKNEAGQKKWQKLYKQRGFKTWAAWRAQYIQPLKLDKLNWQLYQINNPLSSITNFYGGSFTSWKKFAYKNKNTLSFKQLAKLKQIQEYPGILKIAKKFPKQTNLIGIIFKHKIYIIEGMHRSCALALLQKNKSSKKITVNIALAGYPFKKMPIVGQN